MKRLESLVTSHNDVDVWENAEGGIDFDVIGATHATWHPERLMTGHAWDALTGAALSHPGRIRRLLMLGLGGGTVLRQIRHFLPGARLTAVEIDEGMIRLARHYMDLDALHARILHADAYEYLETAKGAFDVVIDDLYRCGDRDVERPRAVDQAGVDALLRRVADDGILVMNFVTGPGHARPHRAAKALFRETFSDTAAVRPPLSHNEALVGARRPGGLRPAGDVRALGATLPLPEDRKRWKELRFLQLR
jgi:spermidine synthase